ncbi:hypothetical protein G9A89_003775 [Geosiphon pyriformis]|nr:hypothetical protein G9A89_003775 [Geosiphon pyriformis]
MVTENKTLAAIFLFEFEKTTPVLLFSRAALEEKPITAIYTDAKVDGHSIKLILDSGLAGSIIIVHIITANRVTKTPIGEIDNFPFEINGIIILIKVLHIQTLVTCGHFKPNNAQPLIEFEKETRKPTWELSLVPSWNSNIKEKQKETELTWTSDQAWETKNDYNEPADWEWKEEDNGKRKEKETILKETTSTSEITNGWTSSYLTVEKNFFSWEHGSCQTKTTGYKPITIDNEPCLACGKQLLDKGMWNDIPGQGGMLEGTTPSKILEIKNNPPKPVDIIRIPNLDTFMDKETDSEDFHKYYQNLEQCLEQLNTQLCDHCLIPCDFQYCNECDLIYNPLPCIIYMIPEEIELISSCASKSELPFDSNSNSDNDDNKNTSSSSIQIGDNNDNNSNSDSNSDPKYKQYIALPDLSKEQKLKWYSDNNKGIMPECTHNTDARFDLRYPGKDVIKLEPHLRTCIDLKVALEIPATTITYIIEPNEKIAQTIFLPLVKIMQLVSVENREELRITAKRIQGFRSMSRIDVLVNMAEEKIVDLGEIISMGQAISIPSYGQYMVGIKRKVKKQNQIFEAKPTLCESGEIGFINLHIPAKDYSYIKIPIYNNTGNVIVISAETTIGYLSTEIEN